MMYGARMGINGVRRSGITRALAGIGTGMVALVVVGLAAYAALLLAFLGMAVIVAVVISHPFRSAPAAPIAHVTDDAHRARVASILGR